MRLGMVPFGDDQQMGSEHVAHLLVGRSAGTGSVPSNGIDGLWTLRGGCADVKGEEVGPLLPGSLKFSAEVPEVGDVDWSDFLTIELPPGTGINSCLERVPLIRSNELPQRAGRLNRRLTDTWLDSKAVLDKLDALDDDATNDIRTWIVLTYTDTRCRSASQPDIVGPGVLYQVKSACDGPPVPGADALDVVSSLPVASVLSTHADSSPQSSAPRGDKPFNLRPPYWTNPLLLWPEVIANAYLVDVTVWSIANEPQTFRVSRWSNLARFTVIIRNRQLVRDYRDGLRRVIGHVLAVLRLVLIIVLAALAHRPQVPVFLLVMLSTVRHYGRRGDSDGHSLPVCSASRRPQGAFRRAA
jgi:hypothetical protein